jgi:hypothetical protein
MKKILLIALLFCIAQINAQIITTVAGNNIQGYTGDGGQAINASLNYPSQVVFGHYSANNYFYIADAVNNAVRLVTASTGGVISTIAGNGTAGLSGDGGPATDAMLNGPTGIVRDPAGNIYIADQSNNKIRMVNTAGIISTFAGNGSAAYSGDGGQATSASLNHPSGVAIDGNGYIYISDAGNNCIRRVDGTGIINTYAGTGTAGFSGDGGSAYSAMLNNPDKITIDNWGNIYIADFGNHRIRMINSMGTITTVAGNGTAGFSGDGGPATSASLQFPREVTIDVSGNIFIADEYNNRIRKVDPNGIITTYCGNGTQAYTGDGGLPSNATLANPTGVTFDNSNNLYITDMGNNRVRFVCNSPDTLTGLITDPNSNPVNGGKMYVYQHSIFSQFGTGGVLDTTGTTIINNNGTYRQVLPYGYYNFLVKAVAASSYTNAVSTYYGNVYLADSATYINHDGCTGYSYPYDITIIEIQPPTGTGVISGTVTAEPSYGQRLAHGGNNQVMGAPLKGIDVKLGRNPGGGCAARTTTDTSGAYTFTNVDNGAYYVLVDIANFPMDTILNVTISSGNPNSVNNNYCVDSSLIGSCSKLSCASKPMYTLSNVQAQTWDAYITFPSDITSATWYWGDGTSTAGLYPSHTYTVAGKYDICVTAFSTCGDSSSYCQNDSIYRMSNSGMIQVTVINGVQGISQVSVLKSQVSIYPNPNNGNFIIETSTNTHCIMYDVNGREVLNQIINGKSVINATNLAEGVYNIGIISDEGILNKRLVIVK